MPITAITIENFKGIGRPIKIELNPITLLFGPNSAGKSTIVQALHYAREIFENRNVNPDRTVLGGESVDLGGFESLVYEHDLSLPITLRFDLDLTREDLPNYFRFDREAEDIHWVLSIIDSGWVKVTVKWNEFLKQPFLTEYEVGIGDLPAARIACKDDYKEVFLSHLNFDHPLLNDEEDDSPPEARMDLIEELFNDGLKYGGKIHIESNDVFIPLLSQNHVLPHWENPLFILEEQYTEYDLRGNRLFYHQNVNLLSSIIVGPGELVRDALRKLCYVGPLRKVPGRGHKPSTSPSESRWSDGLAAYDVLYHAEETLIEKVNDWLTEKDRLDSGYILQIKEYWELETANPIALAIRQGRILDEETDFNKILQDMTPKRRLLIRDEARNIELEPQDIGVGISQVLPVITAALHHKTGFVVIEQPELHIHPAFQVALGDIFIEQIEKHPDLTFILETHSEHLMLRFLRRIRETAEHEAPPDRQLHPDDLSIYFIEQGEEGITCMPIRVDKEGDFIDQWPKGFFDERIGELY
jgi:energy-coupling factor transporter ATP-binding protein EcfA2